jgi:hypothetical protein
MDPSGRVLSHALEVLGCEVLRVALFVGEATVEMLDLWIVVPAARLSSCSGVNFYTKPSQTYPSEKEILTCEIQ